MRATKKLFPIIVKPIHTETLTVLSRESGLSRGEVIRQLILREYASRQLAHQATRALAGGER